LPVDINIFI